MSTDSSSESQLKQRKAEEDKISSSDDATGCANDNERREDSSAIKAKERRTTWQSVKYYLNRFRYYHFVFADTLDKYLSAFCLWLINLYLKYYIGVGPQPASVLDMDDVDDDMFDD